MIELIAFLGNHEKEYQKNRHNAGWLLWDKLHFTHLVHFQKKFKSRYANLRMLINKNFSSVQCIYNVINMI